MIDPVKKSIEVPCSQERAFKVFVEEMDSWWPLGKFTTSAMRGTPAKLIRVDAKQGGKIVEIGSDGEEVEWGTIRSYDPHGFVSMDFHIPQPGEKKGTRNLQPGERDDSRSLLEVRFTVLESERTRAEITQSNWEAFGESAEAIRGGYDFGLGMIFEQAYKSACGG